MDKELDEAAQKWVFETNGHKWSNNDNTAGDNYGSFEEGAKWMEERMYSEEDLKEAFKQSRQCKIFEKDMPPVYNEFEDWFQQLKKK